MLRCLLISAFVLSLRCMLSAAEPAAFFEEHCTDCHDAESKKGGLDLTALTLTLADSANFGMWEKVHDRIASGEMPPKKKARPPAEAMRALLGDLDTKLTEADAARVAQEGRVRMRRMTRAEFENTLADLLALPRLDIQALLPADGTVAGFDKIATGLTFRPRISRPTRRQWRRRSTPRLRPATRRRRCSSGASIRRGCSSSSST